MDFDEYMDLMGLTKSSPPPPPLSKLKLWWDLITWSNDKKKQKRVPKRKRFIK